MSEENEQLIPTPGKFGENFLLERELGRGGMGGVYLGRDVMLDRPVAVKVMQKQYGEDPEFLAKFRKEAQAAAKLIHPNIAQIYSYGVVDNMPYIAMELVAGGSLQQIMDNAPEGKTDIPRVLKICEQVAQALRCAADQGLVHGDIKPDNILLDANGNAKLVDFGLAGMQKDTDEIWGTPYYIAPEKLKKEVVDYRADMYNLGGTLYHALTGVAPFEGADATAVVRKRFDGAPKKPSAVRSDIPASVDKLVLKMLELDKKNRYPTFEALLEAFKEVMATGLTASAAPAAKKSTTGTRGKMMLKKGTRHMTKMNLGTSKKLTGAVAGGEEGGEGEGESESGVKTGMKMGMVNMSDAVPEEEEGGNPIKKVIFGVVGGIGLIVAIVGFLVWYKVSDANSRAEEKRNAIVTNIAKAKEAINDTIRVAEKFGKDFEEYAARATTECESATKKIAEAVPEFADRLKPEITQELIDAIALTNKPVVVAVPAGTNGVAAASNAVAAVAAPLPPPPPVEEKKPEPKVVPEEPDEVIPEPEGDDPIKKLEYQIKKLEASKRKSERKFKKEIALVGEDAVKDVNDLWTRAYSCQASVIKIGIEVRKVLDAGTNVESYVAMTEENMNALGALSSTVKDLYDTAKASKEVENVQKGIGYIKSKGAKSLKLTTDNLFRRRAEYERELKKTDYSIDKLKKEMQELVARRNLVEKECAAAKDKFDIMQQNKSFELLQWEASVRELTFLKSNFQTPEGQLAADDQIKKVNAMKAVQEVLSKNMKGFQFKKAKLGKQKATVAEADMNEIKLTISEGGKNRSFKINWVRFYKEFHSNLNELIIHYIENGRKYCSPRLTLQAWGEAMAGAALTLRLICSDDSAAATRGEQIAKDVAKNYPSYVKTLRMMFPDITFEDAPEE